MCLTSKGRGLKGRITSILGSPDPPPVLFLFSFSSSSDDEAFLLQLEVRRRWEVFMEGRFVPVGSSYCKAQGGGVTFDYDWYSWSGVGGNIWNQGLNLKLQRWRKTAWGRSSMQIIQDTTGIIFPALSDGVSNRWPNFKNSFKMRNVWIFYY